MLILTRRPNEKLVLYTASGIKVILTVMAGVRHSSQVRLGIEAPPEVHVDREEIYLRKQAGVPKA